MRYVADGPDVWEVRGGERVRWLGRMDPALARRVAEMLDREDARK